MSAVKVRRETREELDRRKRAGAHYTPKALARFVAESMVRRLSGTTRPLRVVDPSCGEGELLLALRDCLPERVRSRCTLVGIEQDETALAVFRDRLSVVVAPTVELVQGDFLAGFESALFHPRTTDSSPVDAIIANPPYVRTQVIGSRRARDLAARFELTGRVDLYQAFLAAMTARLRRGGVLAVITSNRFLNTRSGEQTRRLLRREFEDIEIIDLGDTKLFEAAVLPAVFIGRKRSTPGLRRGGATARFLRIYESVGEEEVRPKRRPSICSVLHGRRSGVFEVAGRTFNVSTGRVRIPEDASKPWAMLTEEEASWLGILQSRRGCRIGDVARIRVGIKTTADRAFIRRDWNEVPAEVRPEPRFLKLLLSQEDAARWRADGEGRKRKRVLYTHEVSNGQRRPIRFGTRTRAWKYLLANRPQLEGRPYVLDAGRQWYEIWVPQDPAAWSRPKIVFPDISPGPRFFLDRGSSIIDGNCYWITTNDPGDEDLLLLILGVANSSLISRFHELSFQNVLYSQRRRYLTQYVQEYPLPNRGTAAAGRIVQCVRRLVEAGTSAGELERELDDAVCSAFRLDPIRD